MQNARPRTTTKLKDDAAKRMTAKPAVKGDAPAGTKTEKSAKSEKSTPKSAAVDARSTAKNDVAKSSAKAELKKEAKPKADKAKPERSTPKGVAKNSKKQVDKKFTATTRPRTNTVDEKIVAKPSAKPAKDAKAAKEAKAEKAEKTEKTEKAEARSAKPKGAKAKPKPVASTNRKGSVDRSGKDFDSARARAVYEALRQRAGQVIVDDATLDGKKVLARVVWALFAAEGAGSEMGLTAADASALLHLAAGVEVFSTNIARTCRDETALIVESEPDGRIKRYKLTARGREKAREIATHTIA
jgi:hypothetical protein